VFERLLAKVSSHGVASSGARGNDFGIAPLEEMMVPAVSDPAATFALMASAQSLPVVFEEVRIERQLLLTHFEGLDTKAGVILGFAAALAALAPTDVNWVSNLGRVFAVIGGMGALLAFWPRDHAIIDVRGLRGYLTSEPEFTWLRLLDAEIGSVEETIRTVGSKSVRLKVAMLALGTATVLLSAGAGLH
jgi:hypothetical protein